MPQWIDRWTLDRMAYARFGSGDVYVFFSVGDFLDCCGCLLQEREVVEDESAPLGFYLRPVGEEIQTTFHDTQSMVDHLALHRAAGHQVPAGLEAALWADHSRNFPDVPRAVTYDPNRFFKIFRR